VYGGTSSSPGGRKVTGEGYYLTRDRHKVNEGRSGELQRDAITTTDVETILERGIHITVGGALHDHLYGGGRGLGRGGGERIPGVAGENHVRVWIPNNKDHETGPSESSATGKTTSVAFFNKRKKRKDLNCSNHISTELKGQPNKAPNRSIKNWDNAGAHTR